MITITGKVSTFGGPNDTGVGSKEGLALFEPPDIAKPENAGLFLAENPSRFGLARRLNPDALYIACRWDYAQFPKEVLRKTTCTVVNPANGRRVSGVRPADWGPHEDTGRAMDISPGLAKALDLSTDDVATVEIGEQSLTDPPSAPNPSPAKPRPIYPPQTDAEKFFGKIEVGADGRPTSRWEDRALTTINVPYQMRLSWEPTTVIRRITCHRTVRGPLSLIFEAILAHYGSAEAIRSARMDLYGGCYNFRQVRGGHTLSQHSYGAAIDLDPEHNALGGKSTMPEAVVKIFEDAGWTWGGRWSGRPDPMHFQLLRA